MAELVQKTKEGWRDLITRNVANRNDDIDGGDGSYVYIIASAVGEALAMRSANDKAIVDMVPLDGLSETETEDQYGDTCPRVLESGSTGYVAIEAAGAGTTIVVGDELTDNDTKQRFVFAGTSNTLYTDGQLVPVRSVDVGSGTNVAVGKKLNWSTLRAGCYAMATVVDIGDGNGISGGRAKESLDEWHNRIRDMKANPAISGNEAQIILLAEDRTGRTLSNGVVTPGHGLSVEKAFVYPAILGPGTCGLAFTMKVDNWFQSRLPTSLELAAVADYVTDGVAKAGIPGDMGIVPIIVSQEPACPLVKVTLEPSSAFWANRVPWPNYSTTAARLWVGGGTVPTATQFQIARSDGGGDYSGITAPVPGNVFGFLDSGTGRMIRKTIASVSGSGPWTITIDTTAELSDSTTVPYYYRTISPWNSAIQDVADALGKSIAAMGPGEVTNSPPGDGKRRVRCPAPTATRFAIEVTDRIATEVTNAVPAITGASYLDTYPYKTVPVFGLNMVKLFRMIDVGIYKK